MSERLSALLPPLICGTAEFNSQFNADPYSLPTTEIVHRALALGIRAFDTSPYYGPAEQLLGAALDTAFVHDRLARADYLLLTKVGRIASAEFDYSAQWVRQSVQRSLGRLRTSYLDVVYCHDVEFVSADEVLTAVRELRKIRDESGTVRYVGISGYPVRVLCELAELILRETGESLDAVMSYANFTLQNTLLGSIGIPRLRAAGVDVVLNASPLGMGLLRRNGVPVGGQGDFHPAEAGLREACRRASDFCDSHGERLEVIALRFALENWLVEGASVGSFAMAASARPWTPFTKNSRKKQGVTVIGVSTVEELEETMKVWRSILDGIEDLKDELRTSPTFDRDHQWSLQRQQEVRSLSASIRGLMHQWVDFAWPSPEAGYVNLRKMKSRLSGPESTVKDDGDADTAK